MIFQSASDDTLSAATRLAAAPDKVWDLITTVASIADWYDTWDTVEHAASDERLQVGTSFRLIRHRVRGDETALCRVTALHAPTQLSWVEYAPDRPVMSVDFRLVAEGTAGTLLTHTRTFSL